MDAASMRGVEPSWLVAATSAPEERSCCRQASPPAAADACRGVFPCMSLWLRSAGEAENKAESATGSQSGEESMWKRLEGPSEGAGESESSAATENEEGGRRRRRRRRGRRGAG